MASSITTVSNSPSPTLVRFQSSDHGQNVWNIRSASWYTRFVSWWYCAVSRPTHVRPRCVRLRCDCQSFPFAFSPALAWRGLLEREPHTASASRPCPPLHDRPCPSARPAAAVHRSPCHRSGDATAVTATDRIPAAPCTNATRAGATRGGWFCCCYHCSRWRRDVAPRRA